MTPETFLSGRFEGFGCVQSITGTVLRKYRVNVLGVWSEEHRALHMDESYVYVGKEGEIFRRSWAVHTDEHGFIVGHDANQGARFKGRQVGADIRLVFDRPVRPGGRSEPKQIVRFVEIAPNRMMMVGRLMVFGLPLATTHTALTRLD